jgi:DNA-binding IclR family transcriptional regulator
MKQISAVLDAVNRGCVNSDQCAELTGLPLANCSSYLSILANEGLVRVIERERFHIYEHGRGRKMHFYGPKLT